MSKYFISLNNLVYPKTSYVYSNTYSSNINFNKIIIKKKKTWINEFDIVKEWMYCFIIIKVVYYIYILYKNPEQRLSATIQPI